MHKRRLSTGSQRCMMAARTGALMVTRKPYIYAVKNKKTSPKAGFFLLITKPYSPGWIASTGQTAAQAPQSIQRPGSISY